VLSVLPYLFYFTTCLILCDSQGQATDVAKAQEFLSMLLRKGPNAFERFIAALMSCGENQNFIAMKLDPELARKYAASQKAGIDDPGVCSDVSRSFKSVVKSPTKDSGHAQNTYYSKPTILLQAGPKSGATDS